MSRVKNEDEFELRRESVLDTAAEAFAADSYPSVSMNQLAAACGGSKSRLYHYYEGKEAILFDLLDRYTRRLADLVERAQSDARHAKLSARSTLHLLIRTFLAEYATSRTRHVALLNDVKYLAPEQRDVVLARERDVVAAVGRQLGAAYPNKVDDANRTPITMMLFGMMNWTFTWLKPDGPLSYEGYAEMVIDMLENGLGGLGGLGGPDGKKS
ncbi:TetR/AcrR family transcriptional regulator [Ralstonia pickettii]|uniref:TetR/AcrR family transcriptional regulator n=1 Tax=Ralstonia pickettii TaxID=329 RepID=UPI0015C0984D|nr:TetR/AcrR family transcriptional regulator [Ralstonia pickettii]NWK45948.1 TetR/AcrR family transcriptional regulator [Ralstonia pickettii]